MMKQSIFGQTEEVTGIRLFKNEELDLQMRTVLNGDGSISVNAEDAAIGFGWREQKGSQIYPRWRTINGFLKDLKFSQEVAKGSFIPESLYYLLAMKASNRKAQKFQRWLALDVIPSIRKNGSYGGEAAEAPGTKIEIATPDPNQITTADRIRVIELVTNCPGSNIEVVKAIAKPFMVGEPASINIDQVSESAVNSTDRVSNAGYSEEFYYKKFDAYLREHRVVYEDFVKTVGCCSNMVSKWRNGKNRPCRYYRDKIYEALNLPKGYFERRKRRVQS